MKRPYFYFMENVEESIRLEVKTDPDAVRKQALWCGLKPGMRVLDAGCGPGKTSSILHEMIQPGGELLGVDYSEQRIEYARRHYGKKPGMEFRIHDLRDTLNGYGLFDLVWVRFVLEYDILESPEIVKNLTACLKPQGWLCLIDLDNNCLNHWELPAGMEEIIAKITAMLEKHYRYDAYAGRKLYSYLYDLGYRNIEMDMLPHHLIYGKVSEADVYNWAKKVEVTSAKMKSLFDKYPGGHERFLEDSRRFFHDPRRFTYTPMILCKGMKPPLP
jgi:2-polyprenyl-3-methyl-5-hydroxy-6-metoxy-1,4-benzoquinol methylase